MKAILKVALQAAITAIAALFIGLSIGYYVTRMTEEQVIIGLVVSSGMILFTLFFIIWWDRQ